MESSDDEPTEETFNDEDLALIERLRPAYEKAVHRHQPNSESNDCPVDDEWRNDTPLFEFASRMANPIRSICDFADAIPDFNRLSHDDKVVLLRDSCIEILTLMTASRFVKEKGMLPLGNGEEVTRELVEALAMEDCPCHILEAIFEFAGNLSKLNLDCNELALLAAFLLMEIDRPGLSDRATVERIREKIRGTFTRYMAVRRPQTSPQQQWTKIIIEVNGLRSLCKMHTEGLMVRNHENCMEMLPPFLAIFGDPADQAPEVKQEDDAEDNKQVKKEVKKEEKEEKDENVPAGKEGPVEP